MRNSILRTEGLISVEILVKSLDGTRSCSERDEEANEAEELKPNPLKGAFGSLVLGQMHFHWEVDHNGPIPYGSH